MSGNASGLGQTRSLGGAVTDAAETTGQGSTGGTGTPEPVRYEVWRTTTLGGMVRHSTHRYRWVARLVAWEHTKRGWFRYEVRER